MDSLVYLGADTVNPINSGLKTQSDLEESTLGPWDKEALAMDLPPWRLVPRPSY